ncbi:MAG: ABC transporter ATP-binding protein [Acidobacteria bacterium]|nr:MAG: ABC transporter ATP-binding protein [Acidobacteriota bacterium]
MGHPPPRHPPPPPEPPARAPMIRLENVSRTVPGRTLFEGVHWTIHPGDRYGLIGPNGSGKSSLLRILCGQLEPDSGRVHRRRGLRVAYLPQEVEAELPPDAPLIEAALAGAAELKEMARELAELEARIADASGPEQEALTRRYGERRALFEWYGGDAIEARARAVLGGLGFAPDDLGRPIRSFSGGWRMRALLARLLLAGADVLLLDEPTNHLDLEALAWLERHLSGTPAALVIVSHDRVFLDRVTDRTADLACGRLRIARGRFSEWARQREAERREAGRRLRRLREEAARLSRFAERFGAKASKASQARDRERKLARVREEIARIEVEKDAAVRLAWPEPPDGPDPLVELDGIGKRFGDRRVLEDVALVIRPGDRFAVLGPNGAGKTTLLRIVAGELPPDRGRRIAGRGLLAARFAQHQLEAMDPSRSALEWARESAPERSEEHVRAVLARLGLGPEQAARRIGSLSGGERARLGLARLMLRPAHLLLLDEPTNHLDLPLREALEASLAGWRGALLVVSHDRAFLERTTRETLAVENGRVVRLDGGWSRWLAWRAERRVSGGAEAPSAHPRSRAGRRARAEALARRSRELRPLRERAAALEREIEALERRKSELDGALADPATHRDGEAMRRLARERAEIDRKLAAAYASWEEAAAALEEAGG